MTESLEIRHMTRSEVDELVEWAAREGWNPGLHDAGSFWAADPDAFIAAEIAGQLIGGGAITSYQREFGFMGFFIIRPEFRGQGFGNALWHARLDRLLERLDDGATIGMDGVFAMQDYYARGGFEFSHRNLRFRLDRRVRGPGPGQSRENLVPAAEVPFEQIVAYDRGCFPAPRSTFLRRWLTQPDSIALAWLGAQGLAGFGVARRCREGSKIGPLFADDPGVAYALFARLAELASPGPVFLDAPENNPAAMELVRRQAMVEVFGCARMYRGPAPEVGHERIFGVTTFELG